MRGGRHDLTETSGLRLCYAIAGSLSANPPTLLDSIEEVWRSPFEATSLPSDVLYRSTSAFMRCRVSDLSNIVGTVARRNAFDLYHMQTYDIAAYSEKALDPLML